MLSDPWVMPAGDPKLMFGNLESVPFMQPDLDSNFNHLNDPAADRFSIPVVSRPVRDNHDGTFYITKEEAKMHRQ